MNHSDLLSFPSAEETEDTTSPSEAPLSPLEGCHRFYDEGGSLSSEISFMGGVMEGPALFYHPLPPLPSQHLSSVSSSLLLAARMTYAQGVLQGPAVFYGPGAHIQTSGHFHQGHKTGEWTIYHEEGDILRRESYESGVLHGSCVTYYPGGSVMKEEDYHWGLRHGPQITYYEHGGVSESCVYEYGVPGLKRSYTPKGKEK